MSHKENLEIENILLTYIEGLNLIDSKRLTLDTLIEKDLGITGDDAIDFMEEFAQEFDIDIISFNYSKYFGSEGVNIFNVIARLFFFEKHTTHIDMPLSKLVEVIKNRKLE